MLLHEGISALEFGITAGVFGLNWQEDQLPWYDFSVCAVERRAVKVADGITLLAHHGLDRLERADTIIVSGLGDAEAAPQNSVRDALSRAYRRGTRLISIERGVFVLAASGVLDGKRVTTHWKIADEFARQFPRVSVCADKLFIDEGSIVTAVGHAASLDLCLHIVRKDFGADAAHILSQRLVAQPIRDGSLPQFVLPPDQATSDTQLLKVMASLMSAPNQDITIAELAKRAHLSERTLRRRFIEQIGMSPLKWWTTERLRRARLLLEHTDMSVDDIGQEAGFADTDAFRKYFKADSGVTPSAYRSSFRLG